MVNAFWLDSDLEQTARWLVDSHVLSSILENATVLTTAVQANGYPESSDLPFSHADHPLTKWATAHRDNWERLYEYTEAVHEEWRYRWDHPPEKVHGSWVTVQSLDEDVLEDLDWPGAADEPPQVTGDWSADDCVDAYRYYYANEKRHLFEWSKDRSAPPWLDEYVRTAVASE